MREKRPRQCLAGPCRGLPVVAGEPTLRQLIEAQRELTEPFSACHEKGPAPIAGPRIVLQPAQRGAHGKIVFVAHSSARANSRHEKGPAPKCGASPEVRSLSATDHLHKAPKLSASQSAGRAVPAQMKKSPGCHGRGQGVHCTQSISWRQDRVAQAHNAKRHREFRTERAGTGPAPWFHSALSIIAAWAKT